MRRDIVEGIFEMHALVGWWVPCDRYARPPFLCGTDWPRSESAPAIRTYVRELVFGTVHAECALIAADAHIRRMRWQILVTIFAVRPKLQRHDLYLREVKGDYRKSSENFE
jgi:hypothetical protein